MPSDDQLADRVRDVFREKSIASTERRMFGGVCFMVNNKMCVGVTKERLMVRVGPDAYEAALQKKGCVPMEFTGRALRGFVFVHSEGTRSKKDLAAWLQLALDFNPHATRAKPRRPSKGSVRKAKGPGRG